MIKNVFYCWLWTSNGEQVLEKKTKKIERSTINAGLKYKLSHRFLKWKIYNEPDDGMFNFSKNEFFLITPQSNHVLIKEHKVFLRHLFCRYFFEAFMIVIMQNVVKELSALDYELHTLFCYLRSAPPVCKQNYQK